MDYLKREHSDLIKDIADETKEHNVEVGIFLCEKEPGKLEPTRLQLGEEESIVISDCPPGRRLKVAIHSHKCWERGVLADPSPADMIASYFNPEWDVMGIVCPKTRDDRGWVDFVLVSDFHNLPQYFKEKVDKLLEPWIDDNNELDLEAMYTEAPCDVLRASEILKRFSKFKWWKFWEAQKPGEVKIIVRDHAKETAEALTEACRIDIERKEKAEFPKDWTPKMIEAAKNWCESLGIPEEECPERATKVFERMRKSFIG
jgi:hypothetical protein